MTDTIRAELDRRAAALKATNDVLESVKMALRVPGTDRGYTEWAKDLRSLYSSVMEDMRHHVYRHGDGTVRCKHCGVETTAPHHDRCPVRHIWQSLDNMGVGCRIVPAVEAMAPTGTCCACGYSGARETSCEARDDETHCDHWWDGAGEESE